MRTPNTLRVILRLSLLAAAWGLERAADAVCRPDEGITELWRRVLRPWRKA